MVGDQRFPAGVDTAVVVLLPAVGGRFWGVVAHRLVESVARSAPLQKPPPQLRVGVEGLELRLEPFERRTLDWKEEADGLAFRLETHALTSPCA